MSTAMQTTEPAMLERVMLEGDLSNLTIPQRVSYYGQVCESMKLNPLTRPFDYLRLNGKLVLYANKNCAEQIRRNLGISLTLPEKKIESGVYIVTARAEASGRCDEATGAVFVEGLKGEALANAIMKCETKAKRRCTLSFAGLGMLDETEVESIPGAQRVQEKDITEHAQSLVGKPETKAAQSEFEKDQQRLIALSPEVKAFFRWYQKRAKWPEKDARANMLKIMTDNHDDSEQILSFARDNGWKGTPELSDVAADDHLPDAF